MENAKTEKNTKCMLCLSPIDVDKEVLLCFLGASAVHGDCLASFEDGGTSPESEEDN